MVMRQQHLSAPPSCYHQDFHMVGLRPLAVHSNLIFQLSEHGKKKPQ